MTAILQWFIKKFLVEFLWDKLLIGLDRLMEWIKEYQRRSEIKKGNDNQAAVVEAIAEEIKALLKAGQAVPPELYEKLKNESRRLIDGTNNH